MTEAELATVEGSVQAIRSVIERTALAGRGDPYHADIYLHVHDGELNTIVASPGGVVTSYHTFGEGWLDEIGSEQADGTQAVIPVARFLSYLDFASDGGDVQLAFRGTEGATLASVVEVYGALNTRIMLPASDSVIDDVPLGLPERYDDDNVFQSARKDKGGLPVQIRTTADQMARIVEVVQYDPEVTYFPITVEGGDLTLDIGSSDDRDAVWGDLDGSVLEIPTDEDGEPVPVQNDYHEGFEEVWDTVDGEVVLQTAPGGAPLAVVQDVQEAVTLRYTLGNVAE